MDENSEATPQKPRSASPYSPIVIAKCANCRADVILFVDLNEGDTEIWYHLREVGNRKIVGSRSCKRTMAQPEDEQ